MCFVVIFFFNGDNMASALRFQIYKYSIVLLSIENGGSIWHPVFTSLRRSPAGLLSELVVLILCGPHYMSEKNYHSRLPFQDSKVAHIENIVSHADRFQVVATVQVQKRKRRIIVNTMSNDCEKVGIRGNILWMIQSRDDLLACVIIEWIMLVHESLWNRKTSTKFHIKFATAMRTFCEHY